VTTPAIPASPLRSVALVATIVVLASGCAGPAQGTQSAPRPAASAAPAALRPGQYPFTAADVSFMTGMIAHHAQAVIMAGWAPSHGASASLRAFCERIVVGQGDEIVLMQTWLRDHHQPVPSATSTRMHMTMDGMTHDMLMPGMLTDEEMAELDKSRGVEFDRLFLLGMIQHHGGAISMVNQLFGTNGAGEDEVVFRFASDVYADQTTEIDRMQKMLASLQGPNR
jgi:uncharacterized protein (DUF305 family)